MLNGLFKAIMWILIILFTLIIITPILFTILGSFVGYWGKDMFSQGFTFRWYGDIIRQYGHTIFFSIGIALLTVAINTVIGSMCAYYVSQMKGKKAYIIEEFLSLPIAIPGLAIGLALAAQYPQLRSNGLLVLIGHVLITFPVMFRTVLGMLRTKDFKLLDECAASLGAKSVYRFFRVILPAAKLSVLGGAISTLLLSLGEFNITFFVYTPINMTFPVGLYEAYASLRIEVGSAYTVIFMLISLPIVYLMQRTNTTNNIEKIGGV